MWVGTLSLVLVLLAVGGNSQRLPTQTANAVCFHDVRTSSLRLELRIDVNQDAQGTVMAFNEDNTVDGACVANFDGNIWSLTSTVNTDTNQAINNGCGFSVPDPIPATGATYTWRIHYYEFPSRIDVNYGKNQEYTVTCDETTISDNVVTAQVDVTLDAGQTVTIDVYKPEPVLELYCETTTAGQFELVSPTDQLPVGTLCYLELYYQFGTFDENKFYGVAGLRTDVDFEDTFNSGQSLQFFEDDGCQATGPIIPASSYAFTAITGTAGQQRFVQRTGNFNLFSIQSQPTLYFRTFYDLCHGSSGLNGDTLCENPCDHNTNANRRKRQSDDNVRNSTTVGVQIKIDGPESKSTLKDNSLTVYMLLGACVLAAALLLGGVCCFVCVARRRRDQRKKEQPGNFYNSPYHNRAKP